ncbi:MAG: LysR family transcriptional regulator [Hyphomicrobium sp.]
MDKVDQLRVFARVVECQSFSKAADALRMPRSTVSTAVKELEDRVGSRLLSRTTRSVAPTNDGSAFYERCLRLIADHDEMENLFRSPVGRIRGHLKINVPGRIGRLIVAPALPEFLAKFPDITLEVGVTDRTVDLQVEGIDCVIRVGELSDSSLIAQRVGEIAILNCASKAYLDRYGTPRRPHELQRHFTVAYVLPKIAKPVPWEYLHAGGVKTVGAPATVMVDNAEMLIACCLAGLGLIQVPAYDVRTHIERGELVEVMPRYRPAPMPIHIVYQHRRHLSARLQAFIAWASALLRSQAMDSDLEDPVRESTTSVRSALNLRR